LSGPRTGHRDRARPSLTRNNTPRQPSEERRHTRLPHPHARSRRSTRESGPTICPSTAEPRARSQRASLRERSRRLLTHRQRRALRLMAVGHALPSRRRPAWCRTGPVRRGSRARR
jgi:hypothetical protein